MGDKCEHCIHLGYIPMVCRGVMDCDPPEWYCELKCDEYDDDTDECPHFEDGDSYEKYSYDDYMEDHWDEMHGR